MPPVMRPEILFIAHRAPWPPDRGDRIRSWHMLDALLKLAPVHVAALADNDADAAIAREKLAPLCASLSLDVRTVSRPAALARSMVRGTPASVEAFASPMLQQAVDAVLATRPIAAIIAFSGQSAQFVPASYAGRLLMDFVDVDSAKFAQQGRDGSALSPISHVAAREGRRLAAFEVATARRADLSLFVSAAEAGLFRQLSGLDAARVRALDNGIDTARFEPAGDFAPLDFDTRPLGPLTMFTGQMDYQPNIDAVTHFARDILPGLRDQVKSTAFAIVGRAPTREVQALQSIPGVTVTGEVPDTRPWLAAADVIVAPLKLARGVQNKLLEAMAMAKPVVASGPAAQGIDATDGEHLIVADGPSATIAATAALLRDPARRMMMGAAARDRMMARYGWDATLAPLADMLALNQLAS
jgi:polysaccharide biosynthesis protein PslH